MVRATGSPCMPAEVLRSSTMLRFCMTVPAMVLRRRRRRRRRCRGGGGGGSVSGSGRRLVVMVVLLVVAIYVIKLLRCRFSS